MHPECWPHDLAEHVQSCAECSQLARDLRQLEDDWRHLPIPPEAEQAKAAFVQRLPALRATVAPPRRRRRHAPAVRWAIAAMLLTVIAPFLYMIVSPGTASASPDIVDDLIAWNLALTSAEPGARQRLLAEREAGFLDNLQKAKLPKGERELAEKLLENGRWMAANNDPLEEATRLSDIADKLVGRIDMVAKRGDVQETERSVTSYWKVRDEGVHNCIERASQKGWEPEKKQKGFEEIQRHDQWQREQFEKMMERARPDMKKIFESMKNKGRPPFPFHGPGGPGPQFHGFKK
jgi:hypothetical protein